MFLAEKRESRGESGTILVTVIEKNKSNSH